MSQKYNIRDFNLTPNEIAEELCDDKYKTGLNVRKKFEEVLDELGFKREDKYIFKTTATDKGQYIFFREYDADPIGIFKRMFELDYNCITREERDFLINGLISISPFCHDTKQVDALEIVTNENEKTTEKVIGKENKSKKAIAIKALSEYRLARERIDELVNLRYAQTRSIKVYEKLFSEDIQTFDDDLGHLYCLYMDAYPYIEKWRLKWGFIMEHIGRLRMAERYDLRLTGKAYLEGMTDEEWGKFYIKGKITDERLKTIYEQRKVTPQDICDYAVELYEYNAEHINEQEKIKPSGSNNECRIKCKSLVSEIIDASLKDISNKDYFFTVSLAFDELEEIRKILLHKQECRRYEKMMKNLKAEYNVEADDLKKVNEMRDWLKSKRRLMVP